MRPARAHHSASEYDFGKTIEIEGTLIDFRWQNPHVRLSVRSGTNADGKPIIWDIEGSSLSVMRRTNAAPEKLRVGDKIRVAGEPSRRVPNRMFALNLLYADGTELVFLPGGRPRWKTAATGSASTWFDPGTADNASAGIFRVWSSKLDDGQPFWLENYPLTEAARKKRSSWDPINDTVARERRRGLRAAPATDARAAVVVRSRHRLLGAIERSIRKSGRRRSGVGASP